MVGGKEVEAAMPKPTLISIVEDDQPFRESMRKLMTALGYAAEVFPSAADFLASPLLTATACLVTDVQMPGMTGLELHRHLVEAGLARDRAQRESDKALSALRERFEVLSSREREIMVQVTAGRLNKQIAHDIGISESTVKVHRTHLMRKMKARSLPELSRMADVLKLAPEKPARS